VISSQQICLVLSNEKREEGKNSIKDNKKVFSIFIAD
jgi:hypothetical protein